MIVYTIDVSGSTASSFNGTPVEDVNGDGRSNTILDAELAGFIALTQKLITLGAGDIASVGIVVFGTSAATLDMDSATSGIQFSAKAAADTDNNGVYNVIDVLQSIIVGMEGVGTSTSFADGIDTSTTTFNALSIQGSARQLKMWY